MTPMNPIVCVKYRKGAHSVATSRVLDISTIAITRSAAFQSQVCLFDKLWLALPGAGEVSMF
jgi:hypothetical protein